MVDFVSSHVVGTSVVDLYAGVGTFAAFVESDQMDVVAVEKQKKCLELARKNLTSTEFFTQTAEHWSRVNRGRQVDTVIVDPPRTGLESTLVDTIASWEPQAILYVSCDSVTLSRDVKRFSEHGYKMKALRVFDLYPQTSHVETAVFLSKR
jgi:23S rRNA (uracil1939-C5)-methyltransferase